MADFDINAHLRQAGFGTGQQGGASDELKVNEDETPQLLLAGAEKSYTNAIKIATALPLIGWLLERVMPMNPGKAGLTSGLESEGFAGKQIRPQGGGAQGGLLAKIAGELMKNSAIPGGNPYGDGGSASGDSGGGGGGDSGVVASSGGSSFDSGFSGMDSGPIIAAGGGNRFDYSDVSRDLLGDLRSPITPNMGGQGLGAGMTI